MRFSKVPCDMSSYSVGNENGNLMKVKIVVMHEKKNRNRTSFSMDAIRKAEESIKNVPILAYILRDTEGNVSDFDEHNMEMRLREGKDGFEIETYYQEKPIGVVPESCNPRYEEIDGVNHLVVDGYIWKNYSNGADKIIKSSDSKGLSMEIEVLDGNYIEEEDIYDITDFRFLGVTCLGDHVEQGMNGTASISRYSTSADYKKALEDIYKEIYNLERKEDSTMEEVIKEEVIVEETEIVEEIIEEVVAEEVITDEIIEETVEVEEVIAEPIDEEIADEAKEEEVVETIEETVIEDVVVEEVVETNEVSLDCFSTILDEVPDTLEGVVEKIADKFNALNIELQYANARIEELARFKAEKDLEVLKGEVEKIVQKFALDIDLNELKEKVYSNEMTLEVFERELKVLFAEKVMEEKINYSAKEKDATKVVVTDMNEPKAKPYGGILE